MVRTWDKLETVGVDEMLLLAGSHEDGILRRPDCCVLEGRETHQCGDRSLLEANRYLGCYVFMASYGSVHDEELGMGRCCCSRSSAELRIVVGALDS